MRGFISIETSISKLVQMKAFAGLALSNPISNCAYSDICICTYAHLKIYMLGVLRISVHLLVTFNFI